MNTQQQYCTLATINQNKIQLRQDGLSILDQYDFCSIVTLEGDSQFLSVVVNQAGSYRNRSYQNQILIEKYPTYSARLKKYIIFLKIYANDDRTKAIAHTFCCLISNIVIVSGFDKQDLKFLLSPNKIIQQNKQNLSSKTAALIGILEDKQSIQNTQILDKFAQISSSQGLQKNELIQIYPYINAYQVPLQKNQKNLFLLQSTLQDILQQNHGNSTVLIHGEVIQQYAFAIAQQYNKQNQIIPSLAEDQIQVDQDFDNYLAIVDKYNNRCKNTFSNQGQSDIENKLKSIRIQTQQQQLFKNNPHYAKKIGRYMDRKQLQLNNLNQQYNDNYNLNLLQKQSNKSLQIVSSNKNVTQLDVSKQVQKLIVRYNQKARGNNKHQLLTQFLQVFVPTIYTQAGVSTKMDQKINTLSKQNKGLEQQINKLQKKSSSKCCSIM